MPPAMAKPARRSRRGCVGPCRPGDREPPRPTRGRRRAVVQALGAGAVELDVVRGPTDAELLTAGRQLTDEIGQSLVVGVASRVDPRRRRAGHRRDHHRVFGPAWRSGPGESRGLPSPHDGFVVEARFRDRQLEEGPKDDRAFGRGQRFHASELIGRRNRRSCYRASTLTFTTTEKGDGDGDVGLDRPADDHLVRRARRRTARALPRVPAVEVARRVRRMARRRSRCPGSTSPTTATGTRLRDARARRRRCDRRSHLPEHVAAVLRHPRAPQRRPARPAELRTPVGRSAGAQSVAGRLLQSGAGPCTWTDPAPPERRRRRGRGDAVGGRTLRDRRSDAPGRPAQPHRRALLPRPLRPAVACRGRAAVAGAPASRFGQPRRQPRAGRRRRRSPTSTTSSGPG